MRPRSDAHLPPQLLPSPPGDKHPHFLSQIIHICWWVEGTESLGTSSQEEMVNSFSAGTVVQLLTGSHCPQWMWPRKLLAVNCGGGVVTKPMCSFGREDAEDISLQHPLGTGLEWHCSLWGGCQPSSPLEQPGLQFLLLKKSQQRGQNL